MTAGGPPSWVHVSSSGVTRPGRPGIDIEKEPPAVRMNEMLGGILDYKLKGEGGLEGSGGGEVEVTVGGWRARALGEQ